MKVVLWAVGLVLGGFVLLMIIGGLSGQPQSGSGSPQEEAMNVSKRIFATCEQQVLGRQQAKGEHITSAQASAITKCVDGMAAAYVEGTKRGK